MIRLADIAGHEGSLRSLRGGLAEGRLHHSLLFHGPEGVGKRTTALALAAALNCAPEEAGLFGGQEPARRDDACGRCPSCEKIARGAHPDVGYVTLERTVIPIDAIRKLRQEAAFRPFEGRRRIFIVDPADRLSLDAQNALLKTLEEPPPTAVLVLVTSRPRQLLLTTRSRCQALCFGTLPPRLLARRLSQDHGLPPDAALRAARLSGGRYGPALAMDLAQIDASRAELLALLGRLAGPGPRDHVLDDIEMFGEEPEEISSSLELLAGLLRDVMLLGAGAPPESLLHADLAGELAPLATTRDPGLLPARLDRVRLARADLDRSVNRRLLLETMLFDLAEPPGAA